MDRLPNTAAIEMEGASRVRAGKDDGGDLLSDLDNICLDPDPAMTVRIRPAQDPQPQTLWSVDTLSCFQDRLKL